MDPAVVRSVLERFVIDHFPMWNYIVNVLHLDSAGLLLDCTTEVTSTIFKEVIAEYKYASVTQANQTYCSMKTMAAIAMTTLSINTLVYQGMPADSQLLTTLEPVAITFFKTLHSRPANTKNTDLVLNPLTSSTTVNSAGFSTWDDKITKELAQNLSQDKFTTMEYIIRPNKAHVAYV